MKKVIILIALVALSLLGIAQTGTKKKSKGEESNHKGKTSQEQTVKHKKGRHSAATGTSDTDSGGQVNDQKNNVSPSTGNEHEQISWRTNPATGGNNTKNSKAGNNAYDDKEDHGIYSNDEKGKTDRQKRDAASGGNSGTGGVRTDEGRGEGVGSQGSGNEGTGNQTGNVGTGNQTGNGGKGNQGGNFNNDNNAGTGAVETYPGHIPESKPSKNNVNSYDDRGNNYFENEGYNNKGNGGVNTPAKNTNTVTTQNPSKQIDNPDPHIQNGRDNSGEKKKPEHTYNPASEEKPKK